MVQLTTYPQLGVVDAQPPPALPAVRWAHGVAVSMTHVPGVVASVFWSSKQCVGAAAQADMGFRNTGAAKVGEHADVRPVAAGHSTNSAAEADTRRAGKDQNSAAGDAAAV